MTPAQIQEWLTSNQEVLKRKLNLSSWTIKIKVRDKKAPGDSDRSGHTKAEVVRQLYQYKSSELILYAPNIESIEDLEVTLIHELLHIVLSPLEHVFDFMVSRIPEEETHAVQEYGEKMRELAIWELEQMLKAWSQS